jgi:hypothetical protein
MAPLGPNKRMDVKKENQISRDRFAELDAHYTCPKIGSWRHGARTTCLNITFPLMSRNKIMNTHADRPTLFELKLRPTFLLQVLFIGGECSRLYECAAELNAQFAEDLDALESNTEQVIFSLLNLGMLDLFLAQNQFREKPVWDLVPADQRREVIFNPTSWLPEVSPGCHYEIGLTKLGVQLHNDLRAARLPPTC